MNVLKEIEKDELKQRAIEELIKEQDKIIADCQQKYNFCKIQLEKIAILKDISNDSLDDSEAKEKCQEEIDKLIKKSGEANELKSKLEKLKQ
ncbi:hypothetical protein [Clostridium sp. JNZ J1-5]